VPTPELGIEKVWLQISLFRGSLLLIPFGAYQCQFMIGDTGLYSVFVFLNRAVMGRFVVPAGALPVPVSERRHNFLRLLSAALAPPVPVKTGSTTASYSPASQSAFDPRTAGGIDPHRKLRGAR
jgi:hypothetical protein